MRRLVVGLLAVLLLAGCGGDLADPVNTDPHQGWVKIRGTEYDKWRCLGGDKIIYTYDYGDDSGSTVAIKDSEDCK